jgi:uncharacterized membrane protein
MFKWVIAYGACSAAFLVLDSIWLSYAIPKIYRPGFGHLLADKFRLMPALIFYVIYMAGIVLLAVKPAVEAHSITTAAVLGGALGLMCYTTYYMTNLSTLRGWPNGLAIVDLTWGTVATAAATVASYFAMVRLT